MIPLFAGLLTCFNAFFCSRYSLSLEIPALRQQLAVLKRKNPRRRLSPFDQKRKLWATFLRNHRDVIAAMDFFAMPTLIFRVLYCFFVIEHGQRRILHFNVTEHPTSAWVAQQLRDAFPESCPYRYVILDHDAKSGSDVFDLLEASGMRPKRTSPASPWQNGIAEGWIGSYHREILNHVIALNESHLRSLIRDYISYYHADRIHDSLHKDLPEKRSISHRPEQSARLISFPRVDGLHHRYDWQQAAQKGCFRIQNHKELH
jgi:transposase InsO family protein